jgi:hypothetical protein
MPSMKETNRPSNAGYIAKVTVGPDLEAEGVPASATDPAHQFARVEVAWYGTDRLKLSLKDAGPAVIRQAYLPGAGQNVIIDLVAGGGDA